MPNIFKLASVASEAFGIASGVVASSQYVAGLAHKVQQFKKEKQTGSMLGFFAKSVVDSSKQPPTHSNNNAP